jgi:hypothetical protein
MVSRSQAVGRLASLVQRRPVENGSAVARTPRFDAPLGAHLGPCREACLGVRGQRGRLFGGWGEAGVLGLAKCDWESAQRVNVAR